MQLWSISQHGETSTLGYVKVRWPGVASENSERTANWSRLLLRSVALWSQVRPRSVALRLRAGPGRPLETDYTFAVPEDQEERLRLLLAAFFRTHQIGDAEVDVAHNDAERAAMFFYPNESRIGLQYEPLYTNRGNRILYNLRLGDVLPRILEVCADMGLSVAYEVQCAPWSLPRALLKDAFYGTARLQDERVPGDLLRDQQSLSDRLKRATWHVEECLAAPLAEEVENLSESLSNLLCDTVYGAFGAAPRPEVLTAQKAEPFVRRLHSFVLYGPPAEFDSDEVSAAALKEDVDRILSCCKVTTVPPAATESQPPGGGALAAAIGGTPILPPTRSNGATDRFVFVSYSRADSEAMLEIIGELQQKGASFWYDGHNIGGDDWIAALEERLMGCSAVLAIVSPNFLTSKYCAREVSFADALNRPICPIYLSPVELKGGLNFLLHSIQRIDRSDPASLNKLLDAFRHFAPDVINA
jgi:hypothetical protein